MHLEQPLERQDNISEQSKDFDSYLYLQKSVAQLTIVREVTYFKGAIR
jgi:hypothetical protein